MTIVYGLLAALGWGITDLLARFSGRAIGPYRATFLALLPGLAILSLWLALDHAVLMRPAREAPLSAWLAGALSAPVILIATFSLYRALAVGVLGIVSPVTASYGAITAALAAASGEVLGLVTIAGIAATVLGVALTSSPSRRKSGGARHDGAGTLAGIGWALLASAGYGTGTWIQGVLAVPTLGPILPVWLYFVMGTTTLAAFAPAARQTLRLPALRLWPAVFGPGVFSSAAYLAFSAGLATGRIAEVTVLSTLSSGIAALLGRVVLRERLAPHQWLGVVTILVGIALINAGR